MNTECNFGVHLPRPEAEYAVTFKSGRAKRRDAVCQACLINIIRVLNDGQIVVEKL